MSSHRLDVSGARPLTTTLNDPAVTIAQTSAKAGDDVLVVLGGLREIRIGIGEGAKLERRRHMRRKQVYDNGRPVRKDGEFVYEEELYEGLVVVLTGSATVFGRASLTEEEKAASEADRPYEVTPHTSVVARRADAHFLESGELIEEHTIVGMLKAADLLVAAPRGGSDEIGTPGTFSGQKE